jgi:6-phosphogluconate dehydrogenase (decarboxylating)
MIFLANIISINSIAACSASLMVYSNNQTPVQNMNEATIQLVNSIKNEIKKVNSKNTINFVTDPMEASSSDYFIILNQLPQSFRISVNDILINNTFYTNTYFNSGFKSQNEVVKTITNDLTSDALPKMKYCK